MLFKGTLGHSLTAIAAKDLKRQFICLRDETSDRRTRIDHAENEAQTFNCLSIYQ